MFTIQNSHTRLGLFWLLTSITKKQFSISNGATVVWDPLSVPWIWCDKVSRELKKPVLRAVEPRVRPITWKRRRVRGWAYEWVKPFLWKFRMGLTLSLCNIASTCCDLLPLPLRISPPLGQFAIITTQNIAAIGAICYHYHSEYPDTHRNVCQYAGKRITIYKHVCISTLVSQFSSILNDGCDK